MLNDETFLNSLEIYSLMARSQPTQSLLLLLNVGGTCSDILAFIWVNEPIFLFHFAGAPVLHKKIKERLLGATMGTALVSLYFLTLLVAMKLGFNHSQTAGSHPPG